MINLRDAKIRNTPYPHADLSDMFDLDVYAGMLRNWPDEKLFAKMGRGYEKLSLSERNNPDDYRRVIGTTYVWGAVHQYVKGDLFLRDVTELTGIRLSPYEYRARFEFSSMPANGGYIAPHTDIPSKVVTICAYLPTPSWKPEWGGGTDILVPKEGTTPADYKTPLGDFDIVHTTPFIPNAGVLFIKSDDSWHSAGPFAGPEGEWRRSLTINIERVK